MPPLRPGDVGELGAEGSGGLPGVRGADPELVAGADIAVVRQQPGDRAAVVAGVAARTAGLGLVPPRLPVRLGAAHLGQCPPEVPGWPAGDVGEPAGDDVAAAGSRTRAADLVPQLGGVQAVQAGQAGQVGREGFVPGRRDGDREPHQPVSGPAARRAGDRVMPARSAA